jgi:cell wall-associated NlpC family hydrolase
MTDQGGLFVHGVRRLPPIVKLASVPLTLAVALAVGSVAVNLTATRAGAETPAQRIARLRAEAAKVQATIDQMNNQVESLAEQYDANQEKLSATLDREQQTRQHMTAAQQQLAAAETTLGNRLRAVYEGGPASAVEAFLQVHSLDDLVTMTQFQTSASRADAEAIAQVNATKRHLAEVAGTLTAQEREQHGIQAQLASQRKAIQHKLAQQQAFLAKVNTQVKQAVAAEQARQEALRRAALARKLAAARAAAAAAAKAKAQAQASAAAAASASSTSSSSTTTTSTTTTTTTAASGAATAIAFARAQLGDPYLFGGTGPDAWDCSGLTQASWRAAGVALPRTAAEQWYAGSHPASMADLAPGDLVFYAYNLSDPSTIHHVGLYIGDGLMIEAPHTGEVVRIASINRSDYFGATRPA